MELPLAGRSILVVEDNAIIAMDVVQGLQAAGAPVSEARSLSDALCKVESPTLSAAVLDHALNDGEASQNLRPAGPEEHPVRDLQWLRPCRGPLQ